MPITRRPERKERVRRRVVGGYRARPLISGRTEIEGSGRSRRCLYAPSTLGGHDARRPRPAADCRVRHGRRSPALAAEKRPAQRDGRGGRHARRRPGGHGHRVGSRVPRCGRSAAVSSDPKLPKQPGYWKRRARLADTIDWLTAMFAQDCPGYVDDVVLVDSTPVECGRSVETARRSDLAPACAHHYSRSHSRWFWGMRLHLLAAPDGTPRAAILASADQKERDVALRLFEIGLHGGELIVCDKGYAGRDFETCVAERFGATILRPARRDEPARGPALSWIRQRIESIFWTLKDPLRARPHPPPPPRPPPPRTPRSDRHQATGARRRRLAQPLPRPTNPRLRRPRRVTDRGITHLA